MGAVNSCCIPRKSGRDWHENHSSTPKIKGHRRNLSATFNMTLLEEDQNQNLMNINVASEEELMTLPGINRNIAQHIIEYRRQIGGFKKVEDVALVSGVGAMKLSQIRSEICVKRQTGGSGGNSGENSVSGSKQDLSSSLNSGRSSVIKVNVNTSNLFQLMKVKGIGQVIAENITTYRDKKGPFKSLDDLLKVKGIGPNLLSAIRPQLYLEETANGSPTLTGIHNNGSIPRTLSNDKNSTTDTLNDINSRVLTASTENMLNIIGPIVKKSARPKVTPFTHKYKNRNVVRLASWNVERFSDEKASNPGVKEVICMTILENGLSFVAFQELAEANALDIICEELNNPTLPNVKNWQGHKGVWKVSVSKAAGWMYQSMEYNGFLYDTSQGIELINSTLLEKPKKGPKQFARRPFIGVLKMKKFDCIIVSVHLKATGLSNEDLSRLQEEIDKVPMIVEAIEDHFPGEKDIILLGDFNLSPDEEDFDVLRKNGYTNCLPDGEFTNISNNNSKGSKIYDHIWLTKDTAQVYTGRSGVIRDGLTSPWIPNGWGWGGVVSDHCPVWTELYNGKDLDKADLGGISADTVKFTVGVDG